MGEKIWQITVFAGSTVMLANSKLNRIVKVVKQLKARSFGASVNYIVAMPKKSKIIAVNVSSFLAIN